MYKCTVFNANKNTVDKFAWSPYNDNSFIFTTHEIKNLMALYDVYVSNWTLNITCDLLTDAVRTYRRTQYLSKYTKNIYYCVLNLDNIESSENRDIVLDFFEEYRCVIGESRSYNEKQGNFNLKGVLGIKVQDIREMKLTLQEIKVQLQEYCNVNINTTKIGSFNAPIGKKKVLLNNDDNTYKLYTYSGKLLNPKNFGDFSLFQKNHDNLSKAKSTAELCLRMFLLIGFTRIQPKDKENPEEMQYFTKDKEIYRWIPDSPYIMRHELYTNSVNIYKAVNSTEIGKKLQRIQIDYSNALEDVHDVPRCTTIETDEKFLEVQGKDTKILEWLDEPLGLLSIKSAMGTGKSNIIKYVIEKAHERNQRIICISNRKSIARDMAQKYNLKLYNRDYYHKGDSIVVQFDSLYKYDVRNFDLVIIDEFISLITHARSGLQNTPVNLAKLYVYFGMKICIADAFLPGYEKKILQRTCNAGPVLEIQNRYLDNTDVQIYKDSNYFSSECIKDCEINKSKGTKTTISCTSTKYLETMKRELTSRGLSCISLDANTPKSTKELILNLMDKTHHDKWDVLLYSPTLTVGISNLNNNASHWHYDSSMSCDVISSIQMLKRSRKAKKINMFISERRNPKYRIIEPQELLQEYKSNYTNQSSTQFLFGYNDYGETSLTALGELVINIDVFKNTLEYNHREAMLWFMRWHFRKLPSPQQKTLKENVFSGSPESPESPGSTEEEFLKLSGITPKSKIPEGLQEMDVYIKSTTDLEVREKILFEVLPNWKIKTFVYKCNFYEVLLSLKEGKTDVQDIKRRYSYATENCNIDEMQFFKNILKYLSTSGTEGFDVLKKPCLIKTKLDKTLQQVLKSCGFTITGCKPGIKGLMVHPDIHKYHKYIKEYK